LSKWQPSKKQIDTLLSLLLLLQTNIYYSAVESKKLQEHSTTEKNETNDSVTRVKNRKSEIKRATEQQCLEPSFEGDQRWRSQMTDRSKR